MQVRSLGQADPLEEGMATHSNILPGESHEQRSLTGYCPWDLKRAGHNSVTKAQIYMHKDFSNAVQNKSEIRTKAISFSRESSQSRDRTCIS